MAYDASQDQSEDDESQKNAANQNAGQPNTQLSGGGGGFAGQSGASASGSAGGAAPGAPGSAAQTPSSSGSWTNLNSYLDANADQASQIGSNIANTVGTQAAQTNSDLSSVQQGFQNQTPYQNINATTTSGVDQAFSNPSQYSAVGADVSQPESYLNNNYGQTAQTGDITQYGAGTTNADGTTTASTTTGPTWANVQTDLTNANTNLQDTQSESGRDLLLQNQYANNGQNYNAGEQSFDQLLLQQTPANQTALNNVYNQYAPQLLQAQATTATGTDAATQNAAAAAGESLAEYNAIQNAQTYNTNEMNAATGYQTQAQNDLASDVSGLGTNVSSELSNANTNYNNQYNQLATDLKSNELSTAEQQALGLQSGPIDTYGVQASNFFTPETSANPYTANSAASSQDWGNYSGLQNILAGYSGTGAGPSQSTDATNLANAGLTGTQAQAATVASPYSNFNNANFSQAVNNAQTGYTQAATAADQTLASLTNGFLGSPQSMGTSMPATPQDQASYLNSWLSSAQGQANQQNDPAYFQQVQNALAAYNSAQSMNTYLDGTKAVTTPTGGGTGPVTVRRVNTGA